MAQHADTCDLSNLDSPSSTVAIVRERSEDVDYLVLSDSPVVPRDKAGAIDVVHDSRNDFLPGYTVRSSASSATRPAAFGSLAPGPRAAYEALTGSIPRGQLDCAGLFTDGASRLAERHGLRWAGLVQLLDQDGPAAIIHRVRHEDEQVASHNPGKVHDDATAVICRF